MRDLYERFKEMLITHQQEVMNEKDEFNRTINGLTKEASLYKLQLDGYDEEIKRNIKSINKKIQKLKIED